jgi:hypothetical protein
MQTIRIRTRGARSEGKGYVAEITGVTSRRGLRREFLRAVEYDGDEAVFALEPGKVYEVKDLSASGRTYRNFDEEGHDRGYLLSGEILAKVMVNGRINEKRLEREYA